MGFMQCSLTAKLARQRGQAGDIAGEHQTNEALQSRYQQEWGEWGEWRRKAPICRRDIATYMDRGLARNSVRQADGGSGVGVGCLVWELPAAVMRSEAAVSRGGETSRVWTLG